MTETSITTSDIRRLEPDERGFLRGLKLLWSTAASVQTFLVLAPLLLAVFLLGTLIPQNEPPEILLERWGRFWGWIVLRLQLHDLYHTWWFNTLLALLGINLLACSINRIRALWDRPGVFLTHIAVLMILAGALVRGIFSQRGMLSLKEGELTSEFVSPNQTSLWLPFTVKLHKFSLDYWEEPGHFLHLALPTLGIHETFKARVGDTIKLDHQSAAIQVINFYPDFVLTESGPQTRSMEPRNPALELKIRRGNKVQRLWTFANFPEMHEERFPDGKITYQYFPGNIRQYRSEVGIYESGKEQFKKIIFVNEPLSYKGYTLYQHSYDPKTMTQSNLLVAQDPGVPLVYAGFILLPLGLGWNFRWRKK